ALPICCATLPNRCTRVSSTRPRPRRSMAASHRALRPQRFRSAIDGVPCGSARGEEKQCREAITDARYEQRAPEPVGRRLRAGRDDFIGARSNVAVTERREIAQLRREGTGGEVVTRQSEDDRTRGATDEMHADHEKRRC